MGEIHKRWLMIRRKSNGAGFALVRSLTLLLWILGLLDLNGPAMGQVLEFDDTFEHPEGMRFDPGLWWYLGSYPEDQTPNPCAHDGLGHLVLRGKNSWNDPAITTAGGAFYPISEQGDVEYQIDFRLETPDHQYQYIGLASYVSLENYRAFLLRPDGMLGLTTSQYGAGLQGPQIPIRGIDTETSYATGQPIGLRIVMKTDGTLLWFYDAGEGYQPVVPVSTADNPVRKADMDVVTSWPVGSGGIDDPGAAPWPLAYHLNIQCNGTGSSNPMLLLDRVSVTTSMPSGAHFRNGLRSGNLFRPAIFADSPAPVPLPPGYPAGKIVFEDSFDGGAESPPDAIWRYLSYSGTFRHDGQGRLVGIRAADSGAYNNPAIETRSSNPFYIPGDGAADYMVEFRIIVPEYQFHWLGIGSERSLTNFRGFLLVGDSAANNGSRNGSINLMLNQDPGFQCGWGLETDTNYTVDQPIGLLMWLHSDGRLSWHFDSGSGYHPLTATASNLAWDNIPMALSWPVGQGDRFFIKIDCNGWQSFTTPNLLIDRVTVFELPAGTSAAQAWNIYD